MIQNLEIEYKTLLTQKQYQQLMDVFGFPEPLRQDNYYYDTADHALLRQQAMCRIRNLDNGFLFTYKENHVEGVLEYEKKLTELSLVDDELIVFFASKDIRVDALALLASSTTFRSVKCDDLGLWCLDRNIFAETTDYELEYEIVLDPDSAFHRYRAVLAQMNIDYQAARPKFLRSLDPNLPIS